MESNKQDAIYVLFCRLQTVFGNDDRDVTKEDLSKLVYLDAVIKESIRLYPTVALTGRDIEEDLKLRKQFHNFLVIKHCTL